MLENMVFFEIVADPEAAGNGLCAAGEGADALCFRRTEVDAETRSRLEEELKAWEVVDTFRWKYEDLAYDDGSSDEGERVVPFSDILFGGSYASNQLRGGCLLKDGAFAGVVIKVENTTSFGMAVGREEGFGALLTDGRRIGKTAYHYFHSSTEISESHDSVYTLRRKEGEA